MLNSCWCNIFLDAYTYTTNYLLFAVTIIIVSILSVWLYEKPRVYKLIFKRSKASISGNTPSPSQSDEILRSPINKLDQESLFKRKQPNMSPSPTPSDEAFKNLMNLLDQEVNNTIEENKATESEQHNSLFETSGVPP